MLTEVINVVLISTLDIPLTLLLGYFLLKERTAKGTILGACLGVLGVAMTFFLHKPETMPMPMKMTMINIGDNPVSHFLVTLPLSGEICVALGVLFTVLAVELSREHLKDVPEGIYSVFRMIVGACIFFVIVLIMLGWVHFIDIFAPILWQWMLLYGGVIIAGGIYSWHKAIKITKSADLAITNAFTPIAGILFAYLILQEIPEKGQIIGGIIILIGIFIALVETLHYERFRKEEIRFPKPGSFSGV